MTEMPKAPVDFSKMSLASIVKSMTPQQQREFVFRTGLADTSKIGKKQLAEIERDVELGFLDFLDPAEKAVLRYSWKFWARPSQIVDMEDPSWTVWLALAGRGFGKALDIKTPVPTVDGWKAMGELRDGDRVFDETGRSCAVLRAHPVMIGRECFRVRFSDGSEVVADGDHLWTTIDRRTRKALRRRVAGAHSSKPQCQPRFAPKTLTTKQIAESLYDGKEVNHCIPCTGPLEAPHADLAVDPYLLGCWLGDGSSHGAAITTADSEIREAFEAAGYTLNIYNRCGAACTYGIDSGARRRCATTGRMLPAERGFLFDLRSMGLIDRKRIPAPYLRSSPEQRLSLLQGLFDTDGYCDPRTGASEFCSTNEALAHGVRELALSLGLKAVIHVGRATLNGKDCGSKYRVFFTAHSDIKLFRLSRKQASMPSRGSQSDRAYRRYIVAVEPVPSVPVRCITVDSPSRLYLAGEAMIPTHNTKLGAEWVRELVEGQGAIRIALIGPTAASTRDVMVKGDSGILACSPPWLRAEYSPANSVVKWANGAQAHLFSAEEPERLRGPQFHYIWADEICAWGKNAQDVWDMSQMCLRLGQKPRVVVTTTPKPTPVLRKLVDDKTTRRVGGSTYENADNLAPTFISTIVSQYEGTDLGRQELHAELLTENKNAHWNRALLAATRKRDADITFEDMIRVVVAVDPPATSGDKADECGITVCGRGIDKHGYVLADLSGRMSPQKWAQTALQAAKDFGADRIIAERNNGGDMVKHTIRSFKSGGLDGSKVHVKTVFASRGKWTRAEPIAALFQQGRCHMVGIHPKLEDQMCEYDPFEGNKSPDRYDAMVWGLWDLMLTSGNRFFL